MREICQYDIFMHRLAASSSCRISVIAQEKLDCSRALSIVWYSYVSQRFSDEVLFGLIEARELRHHTCAQPSVIQHLFTSAAEIFAYREP